MVVEGSPPRSGETCPCTLASVCQNLTKLDKASFCKPRQVFGHHRVTRLCDLLQSRKFSLLGLRKYRHDLKPGRRLQQWLEPCEYIRRFRHQVHEQRPVAKARYKIGPDLSVELEGFNLLNSKISAIDYYYQSRLPNEGADGKYDIHFHPIESRSARVTLNTRF